MKALEMMTLGPGGDEGGGLAGGDGDRTRTTTGGGLVGLAGAVEGGQVALVLVQPVGVLLRRALPMRLLLPHRRIRGPHRRTLLRRRLTRIRRAFLGDGLALFSTDSRSIVLVLDAETSFCFRR